MSDPQKDAPEPEVAASARARRRLVTLAEALALATVLISALTLWMRWDDRRTDAQQRTAAAAEQRAGAAHDARAREAVLLTGTPKDGGASLALADPRHPVQGISVRFPASLKIAAKESLLEPRIEAGWFDGPILSMTDGGPDEQQGRLPVTITADYWIGDRHVTDSAIYDVVWRTEGRMLRGRAVRLEGVVLRERTASAARLDALWAREKPKR